MRAVWFTTQKGIIGIVIVQDVITKENKSYIGIGEGLNEIKDIEEISKWGSIFPLSEALRLMK